MNKKIKIPHPKIKIHKIVKTSEVKKMRAILACVFQVEISRAKRVRIASSTLNIECVKTPLVQYKKKIIHIFTTSSYTLTMNTPKLVAKQHP